MMKIKMQSTMNHVHDNGERRLEDYDEHDDHDDKNPNYLSKNKNGKAEIRLITKQDN